MRSSYIPRTGVPVTSLRDTAALANEQLALFATSDPTLPLAYLDLVNEFLVGTGMFVFNCLHGCVGIELRLLDCDCFVRGGLLTTAKQAVVVVHTVRQVGVRGSQCHSESHTLLSCHHPPAHAVAVVAVKWTPAETALALLRVACILYTVPLCVRPPPQSNAAQSRIVPGQP